MFKSLDLAGVRFGRLTAIRQDGKDRVGNIMWFCACDCGGQKTVQAVSLNRGRVNSCGCLIIEAARRPKRRHGHGGNPDKGIKPSPTYRAWKNMIARCTQPSNPAYEHYQRRGITVCDRWRKFDNFLADMGERPGGFREYTLERVDNDCGYEPGNCEWATWKVQANNRTDNSGESNPAAKLTAEQVMAIRADTRSQAKIAKAFGVSPSQIGRIKKGSRWNVNP